MSTSEFSELLYEVQDNVEIEIYTRDGSRLYLEIGNADSRAVIKITDSLVKQIVDAFNEAACKGILKEIYEESTR